MIKGEFFPFLSQYFLNRLGDPTKGTYYRCITFRLIRLYPYSLISIQCPSCLLGFCEICQYAHSLGSLECGTVADSVLASVLGPPRLPPMFLCCVLIVRDRPSAPSSDVDDWQSSGADRGLLSRSVDLGLPL